LGETEAFATYEKDDNQLTWPTENGFIRLRVCSENIIRVVVSPVKDLKERESLMIVDYPDQKTNWTVDETDRFLSVETERIVATIDKLNSTVSFTDKEGNIIYSNYFDSNYENPQYLPEEITALSKKWALKKVIWRPSCFPTHLSFFTHGLV